MAAITKITDIRDPALDPYARLTEHQLRSKQHPEKGVFIAESETVISLALDAGVEMVSLLFEQKQYGQAMALAARHAEVPLYTAEDALLSSLTGFALSRGILAVMKRPRLPSVEEIVAHASRIAVLENVADATNVGAMMRSAAALGMDAVLVTPSCADPLLRRAARVSMGTVFQIPWTVIGEDGADWAKNGVESLRGLGFTTVAMALRADTIAIDDPRLKAAERLALILGTEGTGLLDATIGACDHTVKIPMFHGVDSLNVAAASAVAFWETRRR